MSNKAFRIIPPEPGEIFLMDRGGIKPDRMIICKRTKMSFGKEKTEYHLVDLENGEMLEIKTKALDEMGEYVKKRRVYKDNFEMYYENYDFVIDAFYGLKQISKLPQKLFASGENSNRKNFVSSLHSKNLCKQSRNHTSVLS